MTRAQKALCAAYAFISIAALIATWSQNLAYFAPGAPHASRGGLAFLLDARSNPASRSLTVDLGLLLLSAVIFMVIEARRLGVRLVWLYVALGFAVAISVTFPLFMIAREARLAALTTREGAWRLAASDLAGIALVAGATAALCWFELS
jgi:hypothetical protein